MAFFINDKKDNTQKGAKKAKAVAPSKSFAKAGKHAGGGKKMIKTGGTRGS